MSKHAVLGGNGVVGKQTVSALADRGVTVVSVNRQLHEIPNGQAVQADLMDRDDVVRAINGAEVAYLALGLPYSLAVWRREWPVIVDNVIEACRIHDTHLVFLDNVYAYGRVSGLMTEDTPIRPTSKKGQVRADLLAKFVVARDAGLGVTIARSADFYGPGASTSVFNGMAIDAVAAGKAPTWLLNSSLPHSMTYTPDIGAALAILGTDPRGRNGVWHVPTAPALTGEDYLAMATGPGRTHKVMSKMVLRLGGLFVPAAREAVELSYQNTEPYSFDSTKFESTFGVSATGYREGIARTLQYAKER